MQSVFPVRLPVRVYYEDTDFSGLVYHASYLRFLERGRTELLRQIGWTNRGLAEGDGIVFAVRRIEIDYKAPARMDDLLSVQTAIYGLSGASLDFDQSVFRDAQEIVAAKVHVVTLRAGKASRIPGALRSALAAASCALSN